MHLKDLKHLDGDALLGALGVQRRRAGDWVAPAVGGLAVGAVVGAAVALVLAPQSGEALRQGLRRRLDEASGLRPVPPHEFGQAEREERTN